MKNIFLTIAGLLSITFTALASADLSNVDNKALQTLLEEGVPVVDIRRLDEWKTTGVIEGSHLLTFFDEKRRYDAQGWLEKLSAVINPEEPFVLICHSGGRTFSVGDWLGKQFDTVYNVESGIDSWIKDGRDVTPMPSLSAKP